MKGLGWVVILAALLTVTYLVARDLEVLQGRRGGRVVLEPMESAKEAAHAVGRTRDAIQRGVDSIDR